MKIKNSIIVIKRRGWVSFFYSLANYTKFIFNKFILRNNYLKKNIYNFKMLLNIKDRGLSRTLMLFGEREMDHKIILEKTLKKNMQVLDIGANIGYYVLIERNLIGEKGKIVAVEPVDENIELLKKNLQLNKEKSTIVIKGAVSNNNSYNKFYTSEHFNLGTFHYEGSSEKLLNNKKSIKVKTFKLIDICLKEGFPDLIRMDVEGHETKILENLFLNYKKFKKLPKICFETHSIRRGR